MNKRQQMLEGALTKRFPKAVIKIGQYTLIPHVRDGSIVKVEDRTLEDIGGNPERTDIRYENPYTGEIEYVHDIPAPPRLPNSQTVRVFRAIYGIDAMPDWPRMIT